MARLKRQAGPWLKNGLKIVLVAAWAVIMGLMARELTYAPQMVDATPEEGLADHETWMAIYLKGQKVGYSHQTLTNLNPGYIADNKTFLKLKLMGRVQEVRTITSTRMGPDMQVQKFHFFMAAGPVRFQLSGTITGDRLDLTTRTGSYSEKSTIPLAQTPRLSTGLMAFLASRELKPGQRLSLPLFDPSTMSSRPANIVVEGLEDLLIEGERVSAWRVRMDYFDNQAYAWITPGGETVKEEGLLGLSTIKTTVEQARQGLGGAAELVDVIAATSAPTNIELPNPRQTSYLKARLTGLDLDGFELEGGRQKLTGDVIEVTREKLDVRDEVKLPGLARGMEEFLAPEPLVQSRHARVIAQSRKIAGGRVSPLDIMDLTSKWVFENLEKRPTMSVPSALDVLETRVGDCNEHTVLATALLRAARVPARMAVGVVYFEGRFYYHAWVEAYYGRWTSLDPLIHQLPADATHIRFMTGGLDRQAQIVRLIGRLKVEILEYR